VVVSNSVVTPIKPRWDIHAFVAAAFAVPYKYWLTAPVLHSVGIGFWRLTAIWVASACGAAMSLLRISTPALGCGAIVGLLIGGTLAAWMAPNDVPISLYRAFASHLESDWREILILTAAATLAALCCDYFRKL
jgi:hypothetical protein